MSRYRLPIAIAILLAGQSGFASESVVYNESFENDNGGYTVTGAANWEWGTPTYGPTSANSGVKVWGTDLDSVAPGDGDVYSPAIPLRALAAGEYARVRFYAYTDANMTGRSRFYVSTDGTTWSLLAQLYMNETAGWKRYEFDISRFAGGQVYLRFGLLRGGGGKPGFYVDDVAITIFGGVTRSVTLTLEASEASDGSCPWIYTWDGAGFVQDNDIYSVARFTTGEYRDYYRLEKPLVASGDEYHLSIREIEHEDSWTDFVQLLAVDHASDVEIGVDAAGNVSAYRPAELLSPIAVLDDTGIDVTADVDTKDGAGYHAYSEEALEVDFGNVDVSQGARLVLRVKGFVWGEGSPKPFIGPPAVVVQVMDESGVWREVGRLKPRFEWAESVFELDGLLPDGEGRARVRLYSILHDVKYNEVDFVALAVGPEPTHSVVEQSLVWAEFEGENILPLLAAAENSYVPMTTSQELTIGFGATPVTGARRSFVFVSEGYYIPRNTYYLHTWDGASWQLRDGYSFATADETRTFDLSLFLPDPTGQYRVRIWQNYNTTYGDANIDFLGMTVDASPGTLSTATALNGGSPVDIKAALLSSDDNRVNLRNYNGGGRNRWVEASFSDLPSNTPPTSPPGEEPEVTGSTITWTYSDPENDPQTAAEVEVWTEPNGTGDIVWDPPVFETSETSVPYDGPPLTGGDTYYVRVKFTDGTSWSTWQQSEFVANGAPAISGIPATSVLSLASYSFTPEASDPEDDTLTFAIENQPAWASFDTETGELSGTPDVTDVGMHSDIRIGVTDGSSTTWLPAFDIEVILDTDADGYADVEDEFPNDASEWQDTDGDGTGNNADTDDDDDGVSDGEDEFPFDASESVDTDGDGTGNNADTDDDDDGVSDGEDEFPFDASESVDTDGDGTGNNADTDDDDDGVGDALDDLPLDASESVDTDGDGTGNNADTDDDGDGVADGADAFPLDASESVDTDGDGTGNNADTDDDDDGVGDALDGLPLDASESVDTDGDGTGNNADTDDDGDGVADGADAFPLDASEWADTDGDGDGDNLDLDDDDDGVSDGEDEFPFDASESVDTDGDGTGNNADTDDDGDGVSDGEDEFPLDASESVDTDGDGAGNNADTDDDDDGFSDTEESVHGTDPLGADSDGDGVGDGDEVKSYGTDPLSADSDADGVSDLVEVLASGNLDTDGDGLLDVVDADADGDGLGDAAEIALDSDGDGVSDNLDADDDGDGIPTATELENAVSVGDDEDGDGLPNHLDDDSDGDGATDSDEGARDSDGDGQPDYLDSSGSGGMMIGGCAATGMSPVTTLLMALLALVLVMRRRVAKY